MIYLEIVTPEIATPDYVAIITKLVSLFNARDDRVVEYMNEVFSERMSGKFFSTNRGSWRLVEDKEGIQNAFLAIHNPDNNVLWSPMDIYSRGTKVVWEGFWVGSDWKTATGVHISENFKLPIICIFEFEDEKVINFEYFTDTFEMMKLSGRALVKEEDNTKMQQYVSNLVDLGMIPEIILSLYF